jgi:hypothetical protein
MKIEFNQRPLLEFFLYKQHHSEEEIKRLGSWLASNATATNRNPDILDFFLWVPPHQSSEKYINKSYGENIPSEILQIIKGAIEALRNSKVSGYLIIAII